MKRIKITEKALLGRFVGCNCFGQCISEFEDGQTVTWDYRHISDHELHCATRRYANFILVQDVYEARYRVKGAQNELLLMYHSSGRIDIDKECDGHVALAQLADEMGWSAEDIAYC